MVLSVAQRHIGEMIELGEHQRGGDELPGVGMLAQQAVEKAIKAVLAANGTEFTSR
jgi:hypothetical protein